jgi:hypothetical protein
MLGMGVWRNILVGQKVIAYGAHLAVARIVDSLWDPGGRSWSDGQMLQR